MTRLTVKRTSKVFVWRYLSKVRSEVGCVGGKEVRRRGRRSALAFTSPMSAWADQISKIGTALDSNTSVLRADAHRAKASVYALAFTSPISTLAPKLAPPQTTTTTRTAAQQLACVWNKAKFCEARHMTQSLHQSSWCFQQ